MCNIPNNVLNPKLYKKAKKEADEKYKRPTSAYKSMFISKKYQELGGKYSGKKDKTKGTIRWNKKEKWIQVLPYLQQNKIIECGEDNKDTKACRPMIRASKYTPITIGEIVEKHGKQKAIELAKKKNKDMKGKIYWRKGTFKPSK